MIPKVDYLKRSVKLIKQTNQEKNRGGANYIKCQRCSLLIITWTWKDNKEILNN